MTGRDDAGKEWELIRRYPNHHNERTATKGVMGLSLVMRCDGAHDDFLNSVKHIVVVCIVANSCPPTTDWVRCEQ